MAQGERGRYMRHTLTHVLTDLLLRQMHGVAPAIPIYSAEPEAETAADWLEHRQKAKRNAHRQAATLARAGYAISTHICIARN